jgi:flavin-dependent thymidylate synthase
MTNIEKWADQAMFKAAPMEGGRDKRGNIIPQVHLLWMTPDPLGAVAAMCRMYEGKPTYNLSDITDEERNHYWLQVQKTHLRAPLESVKLHFFIEGVTRSFTHQMVRQRTAVYAQESMRFAVKENMAEEISLPPSIAALKEDDPKRVKWDKAVIAISEAYNSLISAGIPAEDARGLAPHAITTRINYVTDLRNLSDHAGNRLCTQAQFEWRIVFLGIVNAIRNYVPNHVSYAWANDNRWQFDTIASSDLFRPVCYQLNRCPFQASFDRSCTIRRRVEFFAQHGRPSSEWDKPYRADYGSEGYENISGIDPAEWLLDPAAARMTGGGGHD